MRGKGKKKEGLVILTAGSGGAGGDPDFFVSRDKDAV